MLLVWRLECIEADADLDLLEPLSSGDDSWLNSSELDSEGYWHADDSPFAWHGDLSDNSDLDV